MSRTLSDLQQQVKAHTLKFNFNWSDYVQYIHLVEEIGELGEALTVQAGDRQAGTGERALADHSDIQEELGDVLFNVIELANKLHLNLDDIFEKSLKRSERKLEKANIQ